MRQGVPYSHVFVYAYCLQQEKKIKEKTLLFHWQTQHSSHFVRHPPCSSNHRFVHSVGRTAAEPAPNLGSKKQTIKENTSLMTVCSRHPLSKEDSKNAQWSVGNTSGTALRPPSPYGGSSTHHPQKSKKRKTRRQGVAVCVALRVSARPGRKENKTRGKEMCAPPHRPSSHAHTSRLPQRAVRRGPSSCVQQARRTGPSS
ncbi:hypothetical protein Tc00.1047053504031.11 [Trypanosoma cruzi]|uniref:Uncharacterized protein n=1 Tax=Trypanosoma cruzi (strain CL Brener) TaxID=353153 RepID=Q4D041_TRYCC|nr:hypothetical protein Tc00.1047053504031.11 [Trypanosoma cruzi]EAN85893.1 hypothetical protein Tc00.1047053504031.11 [Trypanosoma cruzi]|eukprot:XP_807744.1 hypothetical protein [Trypanosoma cruzi strain CL Brener]